MRFLLACQHVESNSQLRTISLAGVLPELFEVAEFPALWPAVYIVFRLVCYKEDFGKEVTAKMVIESPRGEKIASSETKIDLRPPKDVEVKDNTIYFTDMYNRFDWLRFPYPGQYEFTVLLDDVEAGSVPLTLTLDTTGRTANREGFVEC